MKKLTKTEQLLVDVLSHAFDHLEAVKSELRKLNFKGDGTDSAEAESRSKVMTLTLMCFVDIIHDSWSFAYKHFPQYKKMIDEYKNIHKVSVDNSLVPPCKACSRADEENLMPSN